MRFFGWYRPESDRYLHLDLLRFIASAAIVLYHYVSVLDPTSVQGLLGSLNRLPFAVDMFFVISGVIMFDLYDGKLNDWRSYGIFLRRRIARLGPLHYATLAFFIVSGFVAAKLSVHVEHPKTFDPGCIIPNLVFIHSFGVCHSLTYNAPSWSISAEAGMYVLLPVFLWHIRRPLIVWAGLTALIGLLFFAGNFIALPWTLWTYDFGVIRAVPSFLFGLLLAASTQWVVRLPAAGLLMGIGLIAFLAGSIFEASNLFCLLTVYFIVAAGLAADRQAASSAIVRLGAPLGRLTYSIYMLHVPVSVMLITVLGKRFLHLEGGALNLMVAIVGFVILPAVAVASYLFFETPAREALSGRKRRSVNSPAQ